MRVEIVDDHELGDVVYHVIRVPTHRQPTQPGEILVEEFVKPMGLTQRDLAQGIYVPYQRVKELVNRRRGLVVS